MDAGFSAALVLLVEDDYTIRESFAQILEEEGYRTAQAANGREALTYLLQASQRPCVILLDLMMPVMNGWDFRAEQQRNPAIADIPVVVISADRTAGQAVGPLGVHDFLAKPVDIPRLIAAVKSVCQ